MDKIKIGDYIIPTYIDDEWLAQYTGLPCRVLGCIYRDKNNFDTYFIQCQYEGYEPFNLYCPPDKFERKVI